MSDSSPPLYQNKAKHLLDQLGVEHTDKSTQIVSDMIEKLHVEHKKHTDHIYLLHAPQLRLLHDIKSMCRDLSQLDEE